MNDCQQLQERVQQDAQISVPEYEVARGVTLAGQPQPEDWERLAQEGVSLVVNIRSDAQRAARQTANAADFGIRAIHLPLPAYELEPAHLQAFHEVVEEAAGERLYIHCRTASRTALLWLLRRISYQGWSREQAEAELRAAGYGDNDMEVFAFCADDYFERTVELELYLDA